MKANVSELLGLTLVSVERIDNEELRFTTDNGIIYHMYHDQDCCESVTIDDVNGDLNDLVGTPILVAEESTNDKGPGDEREAMTWTFYKFATVKGWVQIRWYGQSNGYYSEAVDFERVEPAN